MIINYRIDNGNDALPYKLIRFGAFQPVYIKSFAFMEDAQEALELIQREAQDVKELERNDTLDDIRRLIHATLPGLDICQCAKKPGDISIQAVLEEMKSIVAERDAFSDHISQAIDDGQMDSPVDSWLRGED